ncbi:MAG: ATP-binding protein, partial [Solirubrobacteraceae bacterium]
MRAEGVLAPGRPVVVLLSGGRDSTCMLDVAVAVCGADAVTALHVNYGLRAAADADEQHCAALCARLGVELAVERAGGAGAASGNVQAWARKLRYDAAARLALARAADIAAG